MGAQHWIVKNGGGHEWGLIKRLVINSGTRQINYADVFVIHTGHIAVFLGTALTSVTRGLPCVCLRHRLWPVG